MLRGCIKVEWRWIKLSIFAVKLTVIGYYRSAIITLEKIFYYLSIITVNFYFILAKIKSLKNLIILIDQNPSFNVTFLFNNKARSTIKVIKNLGL